MRGGRAIVLADGDRPSRAALDVAWPGWSEGVDFVVAADGGARLAADLGLALDAWVGDGDSLGDAGLADLRQSCGPVELPPTDKDEADSELRLRAATRAGAAGVTVR